MHNLSPGTVVNAETRKRKNDEQQCHPVGPSQEPTPKQASRLSRESIRKLLNGFCAEGKKCCAKNCVMRFCDYERSEGGYGLISMTDAVLQCRKEVYRENQDVSQDNIRKELYKCWNADDGTIKYKFFHYGVLGSPPDVPVGIPVRCLGTSKPALSPCTRV